ncbi:tetratricopeptide repeat protein [Nonomuraea sp. NPDC048882]|uniref:tetratricopeptide repeat protein n=1 Tax=Nonomuraea sp. NPDC048882 TaxID=3154347 RepID=UPI0033DCD795
MVRFQILGRVELNAGGQMLDLGRRQRELLAVLLLRANETVTLDHLVEFSFSGRVPPSARRQVQNTAGRLRKALTAAGCPDVITTMAGGYALNAGPETLDLLEWAEHLQAGRQAAAQGREREAAASQTDKEGQAEAHHTLAWIYRQRGDFDEAIRHMRLALDLYRAADVPHGQADIFNGLGFLYVELGECHQALRCCGQALALFQQVENLQGQGQAWAGLGYAHHHLGRHDDAITRYHQALELLRVGRDRATEAETLVHLGDAYAALRSDQSARQAWQDALTVLDELGSPDAEHVRAKLHGSRQ